MSEEMDAPTEEIGEEFKDLNELLQVLKPQLKKSESEEPTILIDWDAGKNKLNEFKKHEETFIIENELLGLKVVASSRNKSIDKLQELCHNSLSWSIKNMPTKIPLGVA